MAQLISNGKAASELRQIAIDISKALEGDEEDQAFEFRANAASWANRIDEIADGIDPVLALVRPPK